MNLRFLHIFLIMLPAIAFLCGCNSNREKEINWDVTLRREGKNPYDTYLAYQSLDYYFPEAHKKPLYSNYNFEKIGRNDMYGTDGQMMLVLIGKSVYFSPAEWSAILAFMQKGNEVMMLAAAIDDKVQSRFHFKQHAGDLSTPLSLYNPGSDNVSVLALNELPGKRFGFWGRDLKGFFKIEDQPAIDSVVFEETDFGKPRVYGKVMDKDSSEFPDFIQYEVGEGHLTLVATPLVLSNFFLLQDSNRIYSDYLWQAIPKKIDQIYWGSYSHRISGESGFTILWRNKATRWAIIIAFFTGIMYLLFQVKRRQRIIPVVAEPVNSSAAFIETVAMLYYNNGDNANLAHKMDQHFMEWVRARFNLNTNLLNDLFAQQLSMKSAMPEEQVKYLLGLIYQLRLNDTPVTDDFLFDLYNSMQQFYKSN